LPISPPPEPSPPLDCTPQLYVTGADGYLYALDPQTGELRWKVQIAEREGSDFFMFVQTDPMTGKVYVSDYLYETPDGDQIGGNELVVVQDGAVVQRIDVPDAPGPVLIDRLHNRLYVTGLGFNAFPPSNTITMLDLSSNAIIASINTGLYNPIIPLLDPLTDELFYVGNDYSIEYQMGIAIWWVNPEPLSLTLLYEVNPSLSLRNATYDEVQRKIYYTDGSSIVMYDIDTDTSTTFMTDEEYLINLVWDPESGLIYAIGDSASRGNDVFIYDPAHPTEPLPSYGLHQDASFLYGLDLDVQHHILFATTMEGDVIGVRTDTGSELFHTNIGTIAVDVKLGSNCQSE
jgi:DNA-binding beta-propeller fold protein YncE